MDFTTLSNGLSIPVIGYGTFPQKESLTENIRNAYEAGFRMFDTSDNYGNESFVGKGLQSIDTTDCIVITKYSRAGQEHRFHDAFLESQNTLGKADIYLLHWPYPFLWKYQWKKMEELYLNGEVKAIGVCNFEIDKLEELLSFCRVPPVINQIERHPLFQQREITEYCNAHHIQVMCYSPVARADKDLMNHPTLVRIAEKYHKTINQVILRWDIDTGTIPIPGASSRPHIFENADVFDFRLTQEEINEINQMEAGKRIRFDPKTRFGKKEKIKFFLEHVRLFFAR